MSWLVDVVFDAFIFVSVAKVACEMEISQCRYIRSESTGSLSKHRQYVTGQSHHPRTLLFRTVYLETSSQIFAVDLNPIIPKDRLRFVQRTSFKERMMYWKTDINSVICTFLLRGGRCDGSPKGYGANKKMV